MDWGNEKTQVKCPFYISHTYPRGKGATAIACEKLPDIENSCTMQICFSKKAELIKYMDKYCKCFSYQKCPLYRHILEEMEKEDDKERAGRTKKAKFIV